MVENGEHTGKAGDGQFLKRGTCVKIWTDWMIDERHNPNFIAGVASEILSEKFGERVHLSRSETFVTGGSIVVRCQVNKICRDFPSSVIVKKTREDEFEYKPDSSETPNSAHWLFNDWAASEFLNDVSSDVPFSPKLYAGSRDFGLIVIEDLGNGEAPNTSDVLLGNDAELAERTLIEHISLIGGLHAATIGRDKEYGRIRQRLEALPKPE